MANYRAVANGNWSALATWQDNSSGSYVASTVLPGAADVVYANNFTVTLDQDITVLELRNNSTTNVNAGGRFDFATGCNTVTANLIFGASINFSCLYNATNNSRTIIGNLQGSNGSAFRQEFGTSANITVIGNLQGGNDLYYVGDAIYWRGSGTLTVNGNITGGTGGGIAVRSEGGNLIVNGACFGGGAAAVRIGFFGTSTFNGLVLGGTSGVGILNDGAGTVFIETAQASNTAVAVNTISTGISVIKNAIFAANGNVPFSGVNTLFNNAGPNTITVLRQNGTTQTLVDGTTGFPIAANVRSGVSYASGALTGTLIVPSPSNVRQGVPTDNTVGTAALTPADFWDYLAASATTAGSLGKRLADNLDATVSSRLASAGYTAPDNANIANIKAKTDLIPNNPASVESTGAQIASFNT